MARTLTLLFAALALAGCAATPQPRMTLAPVPCADGNPDCGYGAGGDYGTGYAYSRAFMPVYPIVVTVPPPVKPPPPPPPPPPPKVRGPAPRERPCPRGDRICP